MLVASAWAPQDQLHLTTGIHPACTRAPPTHTTPQPTQLLQITTSPKLTHSNFLAPNQSCKIWHPLDSMQWLELDKFGVSNGFHSLRTGRSWGYFWNPAPNKAISSLRKARPFRIMTLNNMQTYFQMNIPHNICIPKSFKEKDSSHWLALLQCLHQLQMHCQEKVQLFYRNMADWKWSPSSLSLKKKWLDVKLASKKN